jgi:hypothetical protein
MVSSTSGRRRRRNVARVGTDVLRSVAAVDEDHARPVRASLFLGIAAYEMVITRSPGLISRRRTVDADNAAVGQPLDDVGAEPGAFVDVDDGGLLSGSRFAAAINQSSVSEPT